MSEPSVEVHPRQLTLVCRLVAGLVVDVFGVLAVLLPRGAAGGQTFGLGAGSICTDADSPQVEIAGPIA